MWSQRKHVQLPGYLRPLSVRVKVIEVAGEIDRQRKAHTYSSAVVNESVLLQYAVDTLLDQTLQRLFEVASARCTRTQPRLESSHALKPGRRSCVCIAGRVRFTPPERESPSLCYPSGQGCGSVFHSLEAS